jgi:dihydropteroate synthase
LGTIACLNGEEPLAIERLGASLSAALLAVQHGAAVVRVHDVKDTVQALKVWQAVQALPANSSIV